MKRIISLLLVFALLLPCIGLKAEAAATSGTCGKNLTWKFDTKTGTLTISGTGPMTNYDWEFEKDWAPWVNYADEILEVVIRKGVTSIGNSAFDSDTKTYAKLKAVNIPDSVASIGRYAFVGCKSLTSVTIPDSVTSIGWGAFAHCSGLTSVPLPDSVTSIGDSAFAYCSSLTSVTIPDSVTSIGGEAFENCSSLTSVTISGSVTFIDSFTFAYCRGLTSVTIPDSVTSIGNSAFEDCRSLTSVTIPDSVTSIDDSAFENCSSLTSVTIPDSVTFIGNSAFEDCSSLTSVTIPDSITSIKGYTFSWCTSLASVTIPDSVTCIDQSAFYGCSSLKDVYYGGSPIQREAITIRSYNTDLTNATWHYGAEDPLLPPTVRIATKAATGKPRLSWDAVDGADFYRIYRATSQNGAFSYLKSTRSTAFTDTTAETGANYYYQVKAVVEETGETSRFSNTVNRCCDLPRPVAAATVNAATGKPKLTWEAVDGAQCYRIYRRTSGSDYAYLDSTTSTAFTDQTAEAGINYFYQVKAVHANSHANSAHSATVNRACDLPRPEVTIRLKDGAPSLSWEKIDGAEKYRVYRANAKNGEFKLVKTTITATGFTDTDVTAGKTYYYKVRALHGNSAANSAWSSVKSITAE